MIEFIPEALLNAIIGLAVLGIFAQSLQEITKGPLLLGPLVAFAVSVSSIELLGLGRFFWAIVFGLASRYSSNEDNGTEFAGRALLPISGLPLSMKHRTTRT